MECWALQEMNAFSLESSVRCQMPPPEKADQRISVSGKKVGKDNLTFPYNLIVPLSLSMV